MFYLHFCSMSFFFLFSPRCHQEPSTVHRAHKTPPTGAPSLPHPLPLITMVHNVIEIEVMSRQTNEVAMTSPLVVVLLISLSKSMAVKLSLRSSSRNEKLRPGRHSVQSSSLLPNR